MQVCEPAELRLQDLEPERRLPHVTLCVCFRTAASCSLPRLATSDQGCSLASLCTPSLQGREYCTVADAEIYQIDVDADYQSVDANVTLEVLVLVGYMLILRAGVYYALVRKTSFGKSSIWDKMKMPSCGNPFANCMNPFQSFMKPVDDEATK